MPNQNPTREIFLHLPGWAQVVFYVVGGAASLTFVWGFWIKVRKYRRGRRENRFDRLGRRVWSAFVTILANSTVRKGERFGGIAHTLILWGFLALFIGTCIVAFDHDFLRFFGLKLLQGWFYLGFSLVLDLFGVAFLAGLVMMIWRRAVLKPKALDYARADAQGGNVDRRGFVTDDMIFVWLLLAIGVSGYLVEGFRIGQSMPAFERWSPVGYALGSLVNGASWLRDAHLWSWWLHGIAALLFVAYVPFSKLMHIVTDAANLTFTDPRAGRRLPPLPLAPKADGAMAPAMGYTKITDFTWKELLDFDACTKCGRCHVACPANAAGTTLSPRDLILDLRTFANRTLGTKELLEQQFGAGSMWPQAEGENALAVDVAQQVVRKETLWSCTTCMACMEACPVGIEHLTSIVQMRRHLVDKGEVDGNLQAALQSFAEYGNSFGQSPKKRAQWTKGLPFKVKDARKQPVEYLWFVGDFASYDPRLQSLSRQVAEVFQRAGVDFGILYDGERNAGNDVRRVGEEGLFDMLAEENVKSLAEAQFQRIVTTDPHTLNTLRNEYPDRGAKHDVHHYTGVLATLLEQGKLRVERPLGHRVTYHDPCYLARYNGEIEAPRRVMKALGLTLQDMPRCGANTFCCGAGGGRIWMDTSNETKRTSEQRIEEALALGDVRYFVTACPKDYTMYTDAVKSLGVGDRIVVKDLIELVTEALGPVPVAAGAPA
jgi:Fe-S oxidoreductase/nitrate reductase gamma subunit